MVQTYTPATQEWLDWQRNSGCKLMIAIKGASVGDGLSIGDEMKKALHAILLDSGSGVRPGGTGERFDWGSVQGMVRGLGKSVPVIVAGGLTAENVGEAIEILKPWGWMWFPEWRPGRGRKMRRRCGRLCGRCGKSIGRCLKMATVPRPRKVKVPTLAAKGAARAGHPRVSVSVAEAGRLVFNGGRYVPETLMAALEELEREYERAKRDHKFQHRLEELLRTYAGRPTPLFFCAAADAETWGGEDLFEARRPFCTPGRHKINNCLGQGLLVERMGSDA